MKNHSSKTAFLLVFCSFFYASFEMGAQAQELKSGDNIALGKSVVYNAVPAYEYCTDSDDIKQLTDGKYAGEDEVRNVDNTKSLWVQKGAVGWQNVNPVVITIDLGRVEPISGVSFSTAGGAAGVYWPTAIYMAVSDDNHEWHNAGDLVVLSRKHGVHAPEGYQTFRYLTRELKTRGRYISLFVIGIPFVFADEIEVYRGEEAWLQKGVPGLPISDLTKFVTPESGITSAAQRRLYDDIDTVRVFAENTPLQPERRAAYLARLDTCNDAIAEMQPLPTDFRTVVPINDIHRDILTVYGELLAARDQKPLTAWKQHRYAWLPFLSEPLTDQKAQIAISMLKNQYRSDSFNLTNGTGKPVTVNLVIPAPPNGARNGWLQVNSVAWADTSQGIPVADALIPVQAKNGAYSIDIPAGITRKVWFLVDSSKLAPGQYRSSLAIESAAGRFNIPLSVSVSPIEMMRPRASLTMWDYLDGEGSSYAVTAENRKAAVETLNSHFVDTFWATSSVMPPVEPSSFDADGNLLAPLDFSKLDAWLKRFPQGRHFFVFALFGDSFAGAKMGTPQFDALVASWAKALAEHMISLGKKPSQLGLCLTDEPGTDEQDAIVSAWTKAVKLAAPELTIFSNPSWARPDLTKNQSAITGADILCPAFSTYKEGGEPVKAYFEGLRKKGKQIRTYLANGPARQFDPQGYHRYLSWGAFSMGAVGAGFWSFSDTGGATTSWNEYAGKVNYAAPFFDTNTVYSSVHWEAVREGIEDYEELAMLRDVIGACKNVELKKQGQAVLDESVKAVTGLWAPSFDWQRAADAGVADRQLTRVRAMLTKLAS